MVKIVHIIAFAVLFLVTLAGVLPRVAAGANIDTEAMRQAVEAAAKAEGASAGDFELIDQDGSRFKLSDYFKDGKPLAVSFVYATCPEVCPAITAEFVKAVTDARFKYGNKINALVISFDPGRDTPKKMKEYGLRYTNNFGSFRFATGDGETVKRLAERFGFFYSDRGDGTFDHIDMVTVVKADGSIYKQVYSMRSGGAGLSDRLGELAAGRPVVSGSATIVEKIKFFCYKYDPYTNRYVIDYPVILSVFLQSVVIGAIIFAVWGNRMKRFFVRRFSKSDKGKN
ncbi:SCO family protein [bacterium]|nr:MAG: SCO family protein [bacterium]